MSFLITSALEWSTWPSGPSCLRGERLTFTARWSGSRLTFLPPGTFPNCISQREGWEQFLSWHSHKVFLLKLIATTSLYTIISSRRGEIHVSLCLNHRVPLEKERQHLFLQLCEKRSQAAQVRLRFTRESRAVSMSLDHKRCWTCWAWLCC